MDNATKICANCNVGIGIMKDNVEILSRAIKYLNNTKTSFIANNE